MLLFISLSINVYNILLLVLLLFDDNNVDCCCCDVDIDCNYTILF